MPSVPSAVSPSAGGFLVRGSGPEAIRAVRVGAFARPGQPLDAYALGGDGSPVRLPALPPPLRWSVEVEVAAGQAATVCGVAGI